jgi:hypothetical protein
MLENGSSDLGPAQIDRQRLVIDRARAVPPVVPRRRTSLRQLVDGENAQPRHQQRTEQVHGGGTLPPSRSAHVWIRCTTSAENVEKVVRAPRKPVMKKSLNSGGIRH